MHCELVVPGLFTAAQGVRLPAAELLLARGRRTDDEVRPLERWLTESFADEDEALPAGALTLLAHGGNPGSGLWARADPVHLRLMRDRVTLIPAEAFALSRQEADALCETLNAHFAGRLEFRAVEPARWCICFQQSIEIENRSPLELAGQDVRPGRAADALANEMQMVLHEHPVNEAREGRGEPAVNGLWLWGAGSAPAGVQAPWHSISSDEPIALGFARAAGIRGRNLPADAEALLDRAAEEGRHLIVLDHLRAPTALGDAEACRGRIEALEEKWFAPLLAALRSGRAGMLTLHVPDAGRSVEAIRGDLRRFWRRPRPLARMTA
jgi:hypothetical protein